MGMEDIDFASSGAVSKLTDYGIGPRGLDGIYVTQNGATSVSYPIYDGHGNIISTLSKQGTGGYSYSALRTYDAWGVIRRGAPTGDPKGRYCGSLGHKQDDESGFVYMRARYYEPNSGRFLNEDESRSNSNWFIYTGNNPVNAVDQSGHDSILEWLIKLGIGGTLLSLAKAIYKAFIAKVLSEGTFAAGEALQSFAQQLIAGGQAQFQEGSALLEAGGDSSTQALTQGLGGISLCISGATDVAAGMALYYLAIGIQYLGLLEAG
jgi:RHS repeat-associated protein